MRSRVVLFAAVLVSLIAASPAAAVTISEFSTPPGTSGRFIHPGTDGNLWYTSGGSAPGVGVMSPAGVSLGYIEDARSPFDLVVGPDGSTYWTTFTGGLGRRSPTGTVVQRPTPISGGSTWAITMQPGATSSVVWAKQDPQNGNQAGTCRVTPWNDAGTDNICITSQYVGRTYGFAVDTTGTIWASRIEADVVVSIRPIPIGNTGVLYYADDVRIPLPAGSQPARIAVGPGGDLWVAAYGTNVIEVISNTGVRLRRIALPAGTGPNDLTVGPDGAVWVAGYGNGTIVRVTAAGATTAFPIPSPNSQPIGITTGPDGAIWFTESTTQKVGRLTLDSSSSAQGGRDGSGGGSGGSGGSGGVVIRDTRTPSFTKRPKLSATRFRATKGATLTYSLSEPAKVTVTVQRRAGRRYATFATVKRTGLQGENQLTLKRKVSGKRLRAGRYRVGVTATDAAGNRSATSRVKFTITR